ncbi:MAG: response regulator transcription factor [Candidatus Eremiobacteraeota bacterium]|nr:response regulator transcription factor [Candidatus Eremiobacteraeota bacterium]MCW5869025.1 response regulator transcription factor [Candidatus Eremiobacteraeota bacterium]
MKPYKILVADDDDSIRDSLETVFELEGYEVALAADGRQAMQLFDGNIDLLILDWMMPLMDGIQVCQEVRRVSQVPILMLTARGDLDDKITGLDTGADDYLPKPFKTKELLARVRAQLRRSRAFSKEQLEFGSLVLEPTSRSARWQDQQIFLTALEFQLLQFLVQNPGQVFSKEQLLNHVWGWHEAANLNVVEVHVSSLRQKLGEGAKNLIRTVRGLGYSLGI